MRQTLGDRTTTWPCLILHVALLRFLLETGEAWLDL